ncbi:MAG TPA: AIR synthase-related protein [Solirubrobacteraceae bacterium]|nr:AIR synthase-related protein [Solirubrobacteraceae bacterium]
MPDDLYSAAGVDYDSLDAGKRIALAAALNTSPLLERLGGRASDASRGEPAFAFEFAGRHFAFVMEGLGTKSMLANAYHELTGEDCFDVVAADTVAAIVNDLCCVGALPLVVNAYFATGGSDWYRDPSRVASLVKGWEQACTVAGATWGGGESPSLSGLVTDGEIELAGSAIGAVPANVSGPIYGQDLQAGDEIVIVESSGLHANGASLARSLAAALGDGLLTRLPSGVTFGRSLLSPSRIYVPLVARLLAAEVPVTYISHVTGHGFLKLMRAQRRLRYRIQTLPPVPEVLEFMVAQAGMSTREAYRTFNMGAGFALYCRSGAGKEVVAGAAALGMAAAVRGVVEDGERELVIEPLGLRYEHQELQFAA